jgi:hypothetical protein
MPTKKYAVSYATPELINPRRKQTASISITIEADVGVKPSHSLPRERQCQSGSQQ